MIGGETTVLIRVVQILPIPGRLLLGYLVLGSFTGKKLCTILKRFILDTVLEFEENSYSIKLAWGRKGTVFKFKALKTAVNAIEKDIDLEFEKQPESAIHFSKKEYPFNGNYSLEYVPGTYIT